MSVLSTHGVSLVEHPIRRIGRNNLESHFDNCGQNLRGALVHVTLRIGPRHPFHLFNQRLDLMHKQWVSENLPPVYLQISRPLRRDAPGHLILGKRSGQIDFDLTDQMLRLLEQGRRNGPKPLRSTFDIVGQKFQEWTQGRIFLFRSGF
jgi:hypothetical protein